MTTCDCSGRQHLVCTPVKVWRRVTLTKDPFAAERRKWAAMTLAQALTAGVVLTPHRQHSATCDRYGTYANYAENGGHYHVCLCGDVGGVVCHGPVGLHTTWELSTNA